LIADAKEPIEAGLTADKARWGWSSGITQRPRRPDTLGELPGDVAEWLRSGLQSRLHRFDSGRRLYAFANAVSEDEAKELYHTFAVPAPGAPLFQAATANLNPWTEAKVDTKNPDRGPLLIIDGEQDHTVPWAIANASFKKQQRNKGVTEIVAIRTADTR
jgi:hypothetical protein